MKNWKSLPQLDQQYLWHPFTNQSEWQAQEPLVIVGGQGSYLLDLEGRSYLDGCSSLWCNVHGHRHPRLDQALRQQLDHIAHSTMLGLTHPWAIELAQRLVEITPASLTRVFYSDAGATAVEVALKMALQYWQLKGRSGKTQLASLQEAYHGDTLGSLQVGYSESFHSYFRSLIPPNVRLTPPHLFGREQGLQASQAEAAAIAEAQRVLAEQGPSLAALIVEPLMQGAVGMWAHSPRYLRALRELTQQHDILLICDEVATGFGRTGRMFACEWAEVEPDLMCLAKGLTGGYLPLAATLTSQDVFEAFLGPYERSFFHGHTYTGNPLACAVALENLKIFAEEQVLERLQPLIEHLSGQLEERFRRLPQVADIRQWGLMVGIELQGPPGARLGRLVIEAARRRGAILRPLGNVLVLLPPFSLSLGELQQLLDICYHSILEALPA